MLRKAYLEITNVCNLSCAFCPGTKRSPHFLSREEFSFLAGKLAGHAEYLYFHLMGEPLLHPDLGCFLKQAGALGFKVILTTNATLLPERSELLLSAKALHKVNLSLQSFEANAGSGLESYLAPCVGFARRASALGIRCELRLWNRGGMDRLNPQIGAILEEAFPRPWGRSREGDKLAENVWLEPGERFDWPDPEAPDRGESCFCYALRDHIGVLCDGTVVPCCLDHDGDLALGNLFTQDLDDILNSERAAAIRSGFSERRAVEALCRRCGFARKF